jgi:hypothetical protein
LNAEGSKQSAILTAEGERQAAILRAEGFSNALNKIFEVASTIDEKTMRLQYLDTLKQVGASPSSKVVVPMELSGLVPPSRRSRKRRPRTDRAGTQLRIATAALPPGRVPEPRHLRGVRGRDRDAAHRAGLSQEEVLVALARDGD